jgi:hypothetical protein
VLAEIFILRMEAEARVTAPAAPRLAPAARSLRAWISKLVIALAGDERRRKTGEAR